MKRIINFKKEDNKYVFKEVDKDNKIEIDVNEKTLNGLDFYIQFFNDYSIEDSFEIVDCSIEEDKKEDKLCYPIYKKVSELFLSIDETMKIQLDSEHQKDELIAED